MLSVHFLYFCYLLLWFNCSSTCIMIFQRYGIFAIRKTGMYAIHNIMIELLFKILNVQVLPPLTVQQVRVLMVVNNLHSIHFVVTCKNPEFSNFCGCDSRTPIYFLNGEGFQYGEV